MAESRVNSAFGHRKAWRRILGALFFLTVFGFVAAVLGAYWFGGQVAAPVNAPVAPPAVDLVYENVHFPSESGSTIAGWLFPAANAKATVLLLHGVRSNRWGMVNRVQFLHDAGYAVLAIDFQAHGESPGKHITFGFLESRDARAATEWLHTRMPGKAVGVIGASLGGAAAVLSDPPLTVDAVILEMVYPTITDAVNNRMRASVGSIGPCFSWVLLAQLQPRIGIGVGELCPIEHIASLGCPVFVMGGSADTYTLPSETKDMFEAAREPKELWLVDGAPHRDLCADGGAEYQRRVLTFFSRYLIAKTEDVR